jgi:hypothetical protein
VFVLLAGVIFFQLRFSCSLQRSDTPGIWNIPPLRSATVSSCRESLKGAFIGLPP